jgi:hypothetical protein
MKWLTALALGAGLGFLLPMMLGGQDGVWMHSWTKWGTIHPLPGSPGLLFSVPFALASAIGFRIFFNWHTR